MEQMYTLRQIASILGYSVRYMKNMVADGRFPRGVRALKNGQPYGHPRWSDATVTKWQIAQAEPVQEEKQ